MYLLKRNTEINEEVILNILQQFNTVERPLLEKCDRYYLGKQDIMGKKVMDPSKPCNKIVVNYCASIVDTFAGYLTSIDITYKSDTKDISAIQDILKYNDVSTVDNKLLENALKYGVAYELNYIDEDAQQRFKVLDSRQVIPVYYNDLNQDLACVIRYYWADHNNQEYMVEVYTNDYVFTYKTDNAFGGLSMVGEPVLHHFNQIPVSVFALNDDEESIFSRVISLQDAYNGLISSEVDDFQAFCDAYLVLQGMDVDEDEVAKMKENRVLVIPESGDAQYLVKNISDTQIENMLDNLDEKIHKISHCPDFTKESFGTSSGIALRHKLLGFTNVAGNIKKRMTKVLQKRIELICSILHIMGGEDMWEDVDIQFTENLPVDLNETVNIINSLRGLVSDRTLLTQLPFITNVDDELEAIKAQQKENMMAYGFAHEEDQDEE